MKIYNDITSFQNIKNPIVTAGTFDGVHLGHQKIISRINDVSKSIDGSTVLLTFYPHPRMVLFPEDNELRLLTTQKEKIALLEKSGVEHLIIYPFDKEFSRLSSIEFVRNILVNKIKTKCLVIGYNHHFGRNREGSFQHLKEFSPLYGFDVEEIPAKDIDSVEISSTKIRNALLTGDIETATKYLGYRYSLTGKIILGKKIGKSIGYPTANILLEDNFKLIPADGVYAVKVKYENTYFDGMLNIGKNPTFDGKQRTIEVNIFNFEKEIYNEELTLYFIQRMRDERKFDGKEELITQLQKDSIQSKSILEKHQNFSF